ncbi:GNAT family N-acetyltransferase [Paenibacillus sp. CAU 1782]
MGILDGKIVSAVLLKKRGAKSPGFFQYLFNGGLALAAQIGLKRLTRLLSTLDKMKEACAPYGRDSWYIDSFAVAKGFQGKSLGSALFHDFIFPYASKHGGGLMTLVTHTELNRKFYCKNGFEVFSEYRIGENHNLIPNYSFSQRIKS